MSRFPTEKFLVSELRDTSYITEYCRYSESCSVNLKQVKVQRVVQNLENNLYRCSTHFIGIKFFCVFSLF